MTARQTAQERRDAVIAAAEIEFAAGGFAGTATEAVARRAGVSQPYLFQLFGTKKDLFLAAVRDCFARTTRLFEASGRVAREAGLETDQILEEMGKAYVGMLLADRNQLRLQLHAYAACSEPEIRAVVRDQYVGLWHTVARVSGSDPQSLYPWFATGMLINVIASIDDARTFEEFGAFLDGAAVMA